METANVESLEQADVQSSLCDKHPPGPFGAMLACGVILLLMLTACSPPAHGQVLELRAPAVEARPLTVAVSLEKITVVPSPEDLPSPAKGRWQRFEEALNAGPNRNRRVVESVTNSGVRMACHDPCGAINCCVSSGEFSLAGRGVGR